ncbi:MAG: tetraacyldisaccharide 4'-kinase [Gemmatimonadetes bacterium]|nr:tetraacyldisaccharide 4'-kinase [Gemmatimonadota bacterium]
MPEQLLERRWESTSLGSRAFRFAMSPFGAAFGGIVTLRNAAYDRGWLASRHLGLPTMSVGNLTVGGTGKTPLASWAAAELLAAGHRPAILMRGYGADEELVHRHLLPNVIVVPDRDRVRGAATARAQGATVLVLDDGFQHRRARRDVDLVIVSADRHRQVRLLPAGPWREPMRSLRRATHIVVTRKRTTPLHAREVLEYATRMAPGVPGAVVHLCADHLVDWRSGRRRPLDAAAGARVLAISAIGDPRAFEAQLRLAGVRITSRSFRDHHAYGARDVQRLANDAGALDYAVCTLKDAVKLGPLWPTGGPPLWYLSQRAVIEQGEESMHDAVRRLVAAAPSVRP